MHFPRSLQHRLSLYVSLGLIVFSVLAGGVNYYLAFRQEIGAAAALERQLVQTVQAQAEVAAFAANAQIAEGVIEGLRANPQIRAVRIAGESANLFNIAAGLTSGHNGDESTQYPLFSPVNGVDRIGTLTVVRNETIIHNAARLSAARQTLLMLLQLLATTALISLFARHLIGKPVEQLALALSEVRPGSGARVPVPTMHEHDEIGSLANSANALIDTAEKALTEVRELATTDALTGLMNRRAFMTRIENEFARVKRYELPPACILMLDLDHFKQINDQYGHAAGDLALQVFGRLLADELRKVDSAGRVGGEEFAVVLPATEAQAATSFAERLLQKVALLEVAYGSINLHLTVSIGITQMQSDDNRPEDALARADRALYRAKAAGRNRVMMETAPEPQQKVGPGGTPPVSANEPPSSAAT